MSTLTTSQLAQLRTYLERAGATAGQTNVLLPLLAQEVDHYMWIGLPFDSAVHKVQLEADFNLVTYLRHKHQEQLVVADREEPEQPDLTDIVFANRNRAYGAYDLRRAYNRALVNAIVMTIGIVLLVLALMGAWQRGEWVYLSWSGVAWVVGILLVAFAGFRFYVDSLLPREDD